MSKLDLTSGNYFFDAGDYSYRVYHNAKGQYVVCCFVGSDKTKISHYLVLGVLNPETGEVEISAAGRFKESEQQVKTIRDLTRTLWAPKAEQSDAAGNECEMVERILNDKCAVDLIESIRKERIAYWTENPCFVTRRLYKTASSRELLELGVIRKRLRAAGYSMPE